MVHSVHTIRMRKGRYAGIWVIGATVQGSDLWLQGIPAWIIFPDILYLNSKTRLPWRRFFCAFSSVVRQMPGYNSPRQGTARTLPKLLCWLCIVCFVSFCVLFVCKCVLYYCHRVTVAYQGGWLGGSNPLPPKFRRYRWSPRSHEQ